MLVVVEGNISAGKSTLCRELAKTLGFELFMEPMVTNPYLELYYADAKAYGLKMQLWLLRQRFIMYVDSVLSLQYLSLTIFSNRYCRALRALDGGAKGVVLDRSLMSDVVFADKNVKDGNISPEGYATYTAVRQHLTSLVPLPDVVVSLDATAKVRSFIL